jgi:hypothetical protein
MRSCRRISAGSTIWPFEETVVFMPRKIASYTAEVNKLQADGAPHQRRKIDTRKGGRPQPANRGPAMRAR